MKIFFVIFLSIFLLSACSLVWEKSMTDSGSLASGEQLPDKLTDAERIELIRERRKELDTIRKGDYYTLSNNPEEALTYYLQAVERLPDDVILAKKLWHAYYQKRDWKNAYSQYIRTPIWELTDAERDELLTALFFDETQLDRMGQLAQIALDLGERDFYHIVDTCHTGIHNCIVKIESYAGPSERVNTLRGIILDAAKVSPDYDYRNALVATKLYEYRAYRAVTLLTREILTRRDDYVPVEKLLWFSLYEIGNYTEAKKVLLSVLERTPKDTEIIIKLGDIYFAEHDYATANLYYNNAIFAWYDSKIDIERKLAYSYSRLENIKWMMQVLAYLLEEKDVTESDNAVAISLALQNGENLKAYVWAWNAIKKYPDSAMIAALYITASRMVWKSADATAYLATLPPSVLESPVVRLEQAILMLDSGNTDGALQIFREVYALDEDADFAREAENYIQFIESKKLLESIQENKENEGSSSPPVEEDIPWWR